MNGASVKGFSQDKVHTICHPQDGVCHGKFEIGAAHMSYTSSDKINEAANFCKKAVSS
jgi:hypothetical protein